MRYALGIIAALCAGIAFNVGVLVQKSAVDKTPRQGPLMRSLITHPIWLLGIVLSFVFGTPLYITAIGLIGPALVPGLMSIGLVVLALGAVLVKKERLRKREAIGIVLIVLAVAAFGFSRLEIDVLSFSIKDPKLLKRAGLFEAVTVAAAFGCAIAARRIVPRKKVRLHFEPAAVFHAIRAGLWYNASNLSLGFITAGLARFGTGIFDTGEIAVFSVAVAITVGSGVIGVSSTQHALAYGRATVAIPLQEGVAQIIPVCVFFLVYRPYIPSVNSFAFLGTAVVLLVTGMILLTNRLQVSTPLR